MLRNTSPVAESSTGDKHSKRSYMHVAGDKARNNTSVRGAVQVTEGEIYMKVSWLGSNIGKCNKMLGLRSDHNMLVRVTDRHTSAAQYGAWRR